MNLPSFSRLAIAQPGLELSPAAMAVVSTRYWRTDGVHLTVGFMDNPAAMCGSTNHSWRGFFVQNNNAIVLRGARAVKVFQDAFEAYSEAKELAGLAVVECGRVS